MSKTELFKTLREGDMMVENSEWEEKYLPVGEDIVLVKQYEEDYKIGYNPPILVPIYDESFMEYLAKLWQYRIERKWSVDVLITGDRRVGKSTLAHILASKLYRDFSADNVAFTLEDFQDILRNNPTGGNGTYPVAILDEAGFDLFAQDWADRVQKSMVKTFEVIGAKYQTIFLLAPSPSLINRGFRKLTSYWIYLPSEKMTRGVAEFYEAKIDKYDGSIYYDPQCAFLFKPIDEQHNSHLLPIWQEYERRKMNFISMVLDRMQETGEGDLYKLMLCSVLYRLNERGMTQEELAEWINRDRSTVSRYIKQGKAEENRLLSLRRIRNRTKSGRA